MKSKSNMPIISIIIPFYKGLEFLNDCIDSIINNTFINYEIILVNDAVIDKEIKSLKFKYQNHSNIKVISKGIRLHFTGSCNWGAKHASGDYLLFLNSDTELDSHCLEILYQAVINSNNAIIQPKIVSFSRPHTIDNVGGHYLPWGYGKAIGRDVPVSTNLPYTDPNYASGTAFLISKTHFELIGGFDQWFQYYYEDVDLSLRAKMQGIKIVVCAEALVYHKRSKTINKYYDSNELLFHIRKNRLMTILKNYKQVSLISRLVLLIVADFIHGCTNLLTGKGLQTFQIYLKSYMTVFNYLVTKLNLNIVLHEILPLLDKKSKILDVGSGGGQFFSTMKKLKFQITGIDKHISPNPDIQNIDLNAFSSKTKYQTITLIHVLEHLENIDQALKRISFLLAPNGYLVIEIPLIGNLSAKLLGRDYFIYLDKTHKNFLTKQQLIKLIENHGYQIVRYGNTLFEFPIYILTSIMRCHCLLSIILRLVCFLPFKILTILGHNIEIIRIYCQKNE